MNRSAAEHAVKVLRHVTIPMRDGVRLSAHLTMPVAEGRFPAILEYTPYHKGDYTEPPARFRYFAERGYVIVNVDVRGTGDSEGVTTDVYSDDERRDGYEAIEWIARQSWCDGNVGMFGISYCGVVCWHVAAQAPPHLKAIIVRSGTDDIYTEWTYPGGCPRPYMYENYAPPNPELVGERWSEMWRQRLEGNVPWGIGFISHQTDGPYWRARSLRPDYGRVKCPVFVIDGWADWYATPLLRAFANLNVPKRALIGPWSHMWPDDAIPGPKLDGNRECLKWFDQWLKGIDTGVLREPPVTIFVREYFQPTIMFVEDKGHFRAENEWPIARTREESLSLREGAFEYRPDAGIAAGRHGGGPFPPWGMPLDQRADEIHSLVTTTGPLAEDWEITGNPLAELRVSSTADITLFTVKLSDVAPDGTSNLITKGYLNATHRESHAEPAPLEPGKVYELNVELLACSYRVAKGHRLRVAIAGADLQHCWPTPKPCINTIHAGSRMILPVVPSQAPKLPEPDLRPSPYPLPRREQVAAPEYSVTHDLVRETTTVRYDTRCGAGINRSEFTISRREPARTTCKASYEYRKPMSGMDVVVNTQCVTSSDEKAFHHLVDAAIIVNGRPYFQKSWNISVPRAFC